MAETQNNTPILNRKEWQTMMPAPVTTAAGMFIIKDKIGQFNMYITSATVHYLYDAPQDDWVQIESGAFGTALAAGACGDYGDWSLTYTATGGTTTTVNVNAAVSNIKGFVVGQIIEFLSGTAANVGLRRTIDAISHPGTATGTITLTLDSAVTSSVANTDTFRISSGMFYVLMPGTLTATSFRKYDLATGVWTSCTHTGLSATWGTDGQMVALGDIDIVYDTGTATSGAATTITDSGAAWGTDQFINYQVRITAGLGIGQIRRITANTGTQITVASSWTTNPDATSVYSIEPDENAIYLLGNNAVTMYKYSISANSWATVAPTTARAGAAIAGMSADYIRLTGNATWALLTALKDGKYIYSLRGGTAVLDRFDITGGTAGAGAWDVIAYSPLITTFGLGDSTDYAGEYVFIAKEGTAAIPQRFYKYSVVGNTLEPITTDWYLNGAAVVGGKMFMKYLSDQRNILWLYNLGSTTTNLRRIMIF